MDGDQARPGLAPGSHGTAGTLFAALYGELAPHPDRDPEADRDPYIQFHDRALAMGWLDRLWGMNDAGRGNSLAAPGAPLVTWFQGSLGSVPGDRPLPAQPFLRCAGDATERLGALRLQAAEVLLPTHCLDTSQRPEHARAPSLLTSDWFDSARAAVPVRVTVGSRQGPGGPAAMRRVHGWLGALNQCAFRCGPLTAPDPAPPPLPGTAWHQPLRHRVTFQGMLSEWSLDAIGWLGGFLADLAAREGADAPLLLTVSRSTASR